ncbi:MAG: ATP-binding cassette domain-containing protein, partial [Verrucomicrobiales bacterium]|nr:ATP-binding cassette domain-containing protein [Verrucomicrobiales bacterium]
MKVTHKHPVTFSLESAERYYENTPALNSTTISIEQGERVAIVGPSGSGKTTLLSLFNSTVQASSGKITLLGNALEKTSERNLKKIRSKIATIPQNLALVESLRVWQTYTHKSKSIVELKLLEPKKINNLEIRLKIEIPHQS